MNAPILAVDGLVKDFGGVRAVDGLTASVQQGGITALVGPNGAGKTTLFNIITGFLSPDEGRVTFKGKDIIGLPPQVIPGYGIARTFQNLRLFPNMTALENVMGYLPRRPGENPIIAILRRRSVRASEARDVNEAAGWLDYVGLGNLTTVRASELSYGQQKRVALARVLAQPAELILLDEPCAGLHPGALEGIVEIIRKLPGLGKTVVLVEHNLEVVDVLSDHLLFLNQGQLVAEGSASELFGRSDLSDLYFGTDETPTPPLEGT